jgi:hypothetical protein
LINTQAAGFAEDEPLYRRTLRVAEKSYGKESPFVVDILESYAARLRKTGRDADAAPLEARAKAIRAPK